MAQYNGFTCDSCGKVVSAEERTKRTVRYVGKVVEGEVSTDLCPECVGKPQGLKPLRKRAPKKGRTAEVASD